MKPTYELGRGRVAEGLNENKSVWKLLTCSGFCNWVFIDLFCRADELWGASCHPASGSAGGQHYERCESESVNSSSMLEIVCFLHRCAGFLFIYSTAFLKNVFSNVKFYFGIHCTFAMTTVWSSRWTKAQHSGGRREGTGCRRVLMNAFPKLSDVCFDRFSPDLC